LHKAKLTQSLDLYALHVLKGNWQSLDLYALHVLNQNKLLERIQGHICGLINMTVDCSDKSWYRCIYKMILCVSFRHETMNKAS
jgi:hypothetical protein